MPSPITMYSPARNLAQTCIRRHCNLNTYHKAACNARKDTLHLMQGKIRLPKRSHSKILPMPTTHRYKAAKFNLMAVGEMEVMQHSADFLQRTPPGPRSYALIVLNYQLPSFTPDLWDRAKLRICADGGANRLHDEMPNFFAKENPALVRQRYKPDVIKGDLDSIRPEVLEFYDNMGSTILDESHDQDTTDLHKCVAFIRDCTLDLDKSNLVLIVVGALGGRFDHELGNINVLYRFSDMRIVLLSNDSLLFLLPKTHRHEILVDHSVEGPHCGLIPVGGPSQSTTTSGLQWDLNKTAMRFGSLISTSNILRGEKVTVCSDVDLLWTTSIRKS